LKKIKHFLLFFLTSVVFCFFGLDVINYFKNGHTEYIASFALLLALMINFFLVILTLMGGIWKNSKQYKKSLEENKNEQRARFWANVAHHHYSRRRRRKK
jgi:predicted PurR-regulated permease PerM